MDPFVVLLQVVVVGLIVYVLWWGIDKIGLPEPFRKIAIAIVVLIIVWYLLQLLGAVPRWR